MKALKKKLLLLIVSMYTGKTNRINKTNFNPLNLSLQPFEASISSHFHNYTNIK